MRSFPKAVQKFESKGRVLSRLVAGHFMRGGFLRNAPKLMDFILDFKDLEPMNFRKNTIPHFFSVDVPLWNPLKTKFKLATRDSTL